MTASTLDLTGGSCTSGCFAFRTTAALRKITGLKWSVAQDGSAYVANGDRVLLEALAAPMRWHLDASVPNKDNAIWVSGDDKKNCTLHIARFACETGGFIDKLLEQHAQDTHPTLSRDGFMNGLCAEQLQKLTGYSFKLVSDYEHPNKASCVKATLNADSARGLQAALQEHAGIASQVRLLPCPKDTAQRDRKAELVVHGNLLTLEKLQSLQRNADFKTAFDYGVLDEVAKATSAFRSSYR